MGNAISKLCKKMSNPIKAYEKRKTMKIYKELTLKAAEKNPELVVWPEASTPFYYGLDPTGAKYIQELAKTLKRDVEQDNFVSQ